MKPDTIHNEIQFHKNSTKRQYPAQQDRRDRSQVDDLFGDLSRDLVGADGGLEDRATESEERARDAEGHGD